ncbi:MAG TPA: DNA/RNA nuclease SfsA, partial [Chitinispirillaceae bacterium]|nr:DNA/RNA nuclease SfsA [Chitinispirillaceae bacterium]
IIHTPTILRFTQIFQHSLVIQRNDVEIFAPAFDIDPSYAQKLKNAYLNGVEIIPLQVKISPIKIEPFRVLKYDLARR